MKMIITEKCVVKGWDGGGDNIRNCKITNDNVSCESIELNRSFFKEARRGKDERDVE